MPMEMETFETQLDAVYHHERESPDRVWLTQPMGGGRVRDFTWKQALDEARRMAAHLTSLGYPAGSRISILSKNCAWWFFADLAIWMAGHVTVPIYPTLTAESVREILEHCDAKLVFIGKLDDYATMAPGIPDGVARIQLPLGPDSGGRPWDELVAATAPLEGAPRREPDDLATIVYTSGSTGTPKGVMHSFRTMCAPRAFDAVIAATPEDRMISYLPLAHVAERGCLEIPTMLKGFRVFFAESLDTFLTDLQRARPTIFGSVPRLWLKFQSGVFEKVPPAKLDRLLSIPIVRGLVKRKILRGLGLDQVRYAVCGAAPVPVELLAWYDRLGIEISELYGMTENFAVSHLTRPGRRRLGYVGEATPGVEHRIADTGEVLVKSPGATLGYYRAPELTRELIDDDGWLHTGDRGELDDAGRLKITGRVKELFKSSKGKYIAPAPLENELLASPLVEQACVIGVGLPQPLALVVPSPAARQQPREELERALAALREAINAKVDPHERLDRLVVVGEEWTIANQLLTPTMKLRRPAIEDKYGPRVNAWAEATAPVLWA